MQISEEPEVEIVFIDTEYRYRCKKCHHVFQNLDTFGRHMKKTGHIGIILQIITHDQLIEIP